MIETIEQLRAMPYQEYVNSKWWKAWKRLHKQSKCQICGFRYELDVHHLNYDNLGDEKDSDLITLCRRCHWDEHYYAGCIEPTEKILVKQRWVTEEEYQAKAQALR